MWKSSRASLTQLLGIDHPIIGNEVVWKSSRASLTLGKGDREAVASGAEVVWKSSRASLTLPVRDMDLDDQTRGSVEVQQGFVDTRKTDLWPQQKLLEVVWKSSRASLTHWGDDLCSSRHREVVWKSSRASLTPAVPQAKYPGSSGSSVEVQQGFVDTSSRVRARFLST